jgi:tetratricopeptide (TPR) repeat protein
MYSWEAPKESTRADVLANLDASAFRRRAATELQDAETRLKGANDALARVEAMIALADALQLVGDLDRAYSVAAEAVMTAEERPDSRAFGLARISSTTCAMRSGDLDTARELVSVTIAAAEQAGEPEILGMAQVQLATCEIASGNADDALGVLDAAFATGREHGLTTIKGYALAAVGCCYVLDRTTLATLPILSRAQLLHERVPDLRSLARTYNNLGALYYKDGRFVDGIPYFERALDLLMGVGDIVTILNSINNAVRATELYSFDRAGELRDKMEEFAGVLAAPQQGRFQDQASMALAAAVERSGPEPTFESMLFVEAPILLLPVPDPRRSG